MKKRLILSVAAILTTVLILLTSCGVDNSGTPQDYSTDTTAENTEATDSITTSVEDLPILYQTDTNSIPYPSVWRNMNAVIVKWGGKAEQTWSESYGSVANGNYFVINYLGIEVEFIKIFEQTMSETNMDIGSVIEKTEYLLIPEQCAADIQVGQTALVFLDRIHSGNYGIQLGCRLGSYTEQNNFGEAPIFPIEDGALVISSRAYLTYEGKDHYYLMSDMNHLKEANKYIQKEYVGKPIFENGMLTDTLDEFFDLICQ